MYAYVWLQHVRASNAADYYPELYYKLDKKKDKRWMDGPLVPCRILQIPKKTNRKERENLVFNRALR